MKSFNPIIFVNLIYRHFDILRSHLWSGEKSHAFPGCVKIVLRIHIARAKNLERTQIPPKHIRAPPISMNTTQISR